jgi:hypothetical protein
MLVSCHFPVSIQIEKEKDKNSTFRLNGISYLMKRCMDPFQHMLSVVGRELTSYNASHFVSQYLWNGGVIWSNDYPSEGCFEFVTNGGMWISQFLVSYHRTFYR